MQQDQQNQAKEFTLPKISPFKDHITLRQSKLKSRETPRPRGFLSQDLPSSKKASHNSLVSELIQKHYDSFRHKKSERTKKRELPLLQKNQKHYSFRKNPLKSKKIKTEESKSKPKHCIDMANFIRNKIGEFNGILQNIKCIKNIETPHKILSPARKAEPKKHVESIEDFTPLGAGGSALVEKIRKNEALLSQRQIMSYEVRKKKKQFQYSRKMHYRTLDMDNKEELVEPWGTDTLKKDIAFFEAHHF